LSVLIIDDIKLVFLQAGVKGWHPDFGMVYNHPPHARVEVDVKDQKEDHLYQFHRRLHVLVDVKVLNDFVKTKNTP